MNANQLGEPFGEADCESEMRKGSYEDRFFDETSFNTAALREETYLIVGRKGSGKTALAKYFEFQRHFPGAIAIQLSATELFLHAVREATQTSTLPAEVNIPRLATLWQSMIWTAIFHRLRDVDPRIESAFRATDLPSPEGWFKSLLVSVALKWLYEPPTGRTPSPFFDDESEDIRAGRQAVLEVARQMRLIVSCDTLEHYDIHNDAMMQATAGLIEAASIAQSMYAGDGLHIKVFVSGELFPHLKERFVSNPLKHIRHPVYLSWRPRDLLRLISWRLYVSLQLRHSAALDQDSEIDWGEYQDVLTNIWERSFGADLVNRRGIREATFAYVLRHTQMRPRQLIILCNAAARRAIEDGRFPTISNQNVVDAVAEVEPELAVEIVNSYRAIYPQALDVMDALMGLPTVFAGSDLDKRARHTKRSWRGDYTLQNFRQLVAEMGIVGRVRSRTAKYVRATFEYSTRERLALQPGDECAVHPMFFEKLQVKRDRAEIVIPFPDSSDFREFYDADPG